jgi:TonB family protein
MSESLLREIQQTVRQVSPNIDAGIFRLVGERGNRISLVVMEHGEVPPPPLKPPASFVRAYYEALASKYAQQLDEVQTPTLQGTRVDPAVQNTKLIESPAAVYPPLAKASRTQGTVHLDIEIGPDGHVVKVLPLDGNPLLQQSARNAVFQWVYQPTIEAGQAISVITTVTINFSLAD